VLAEAGLAKGITAQAGGAEVQALFNYAQAITFDPSQLEALSRLNILSTGISGGTVSQRILNDIQARDRWLEVFKETTKFFNDHPPFEIVFDPSLMQIGETDYIKRTANLGMRIALDPSNAGFDALNALLEGLEKTGRRSVWGFTNWPLTDITPKTAGTVLFNGKQNFSCKIDVTLLNEKNKTIGKNSITLTTGIIIFSGNNLAKPSSIDGTVNFPNIKAEDLTPVLTIVIDAVNGINARNLNASGYMKIETGDLEKRIAEREAAEWNVTGHSGTVTSVAFSPDGKQAISGSWDKTLKLWDVATGREIKTFTGHTDRVWSVAFSPDGKQVISCDDKTLKLWDVASGREIRTFSGHSSYVNSVAFSPDGKQVISCSRDETLKLWDIATGKIIRTFSGHSGGVNSVAFSPDGKQVISGSYDKTLKLWDVATGKVIRTFSGRSEGVSTVAFSPDGKQVISGSYDNTLKLWDVATGSLIRTFSGHIQYVASVCFSPDGKYILSGSDDTSIKIWDAVTGRVKTIGKEQENER
jgi:WD40 repeat protein